MTNLWHVFGTQAQRHPARPAIILGDEVRSFGDLKRRALQFAAVYRKHDVVPGSRVLLSISNSSDMAAALLGCWAVDAVAVLLDANSPATHLQHALERTEPKLLVSSPGVELPIVEHDVPGLVTDRVDAGGEAPEAQPAASATEPATIVFTSGSTGHPKGVTQPHANLAAACRAVGGYLGLTGDDRILCPIPWSFDYGYGQLLSTFVLGATHVLPTGGHPHAICGAIEEQRPTVLAAIPSLLGYLLGGMSPFRRTDLSSIRMVTSTGGRVTRRLFEQLREVLPDCDIVLNYGLTESYRTSYLDPARADERPESIGRGIPGVEVLVVRDDGSEAAPGEVGEIVHRGAYLFSGYWNDPAATATALRPDPLADDPAAAPRVLFTGDLGWKDAEGLLYFKTRRDQQLKTRGVRVTPGEVEEILAGCEQVAEVAVFGMPNELMGDEIWAAVVVRPVPGVDDPVAAVEKFARASMSPYMVPWRYLRKDSLPRTRSGKVDYPRLKEEAAALPATSL